MKVKTKCFICAFFLIIITLMISFCFDGLFICKKYRFFFSYTFDDKYKVSRYYYKFEKKINFESANWLIEYTDINGLKHSSIIHSEPEGTDMGESEYYSTNEIRHFLYYEIYDIITNEFDKQLAPQIFPEGKIEYTENYLGRNELYSINKDGLKNLIIISSDINNAIYKSVTTEAKGFKLIDCSLKSVGRDKDFIVIISLSLSDDHISESQFERLEQLEKAYCNYVGEPCNYIFKIWYTERETGRKKEIYRKTVFYGTEITDGSYDHLIPKPFR